MTLLAKGPVRGAYVRLFEGSTITIFRAVNLTNICVVLLSFLNFNTNLHLNLNKLLSVNQDFKTKVLWCTQFWDTAKRFDIRRVPKA